MAQYQTFPGAVGASRTVDKLKALLLPDLAGKRFLDVGCNEGFFCGFARHCGAGRSVGLDQSKLFLDRARARFPDCEFLLQGWDRLPEGEFDVILLASALHYADDQPALLTSLVGKLSHDGVLVVELGIVSSLESEWVEVERGIDRRTFPTMRKLREILAGYAWKWMGPSVMQQGDPVPRHVIHISRRKPIAYLLMQPPGYGKTSIASRLFPAANVHVVSGDEELNGIAKGRKQADARLKRVIDEDFSPFRIDQLIQRIFESGLGSNLVESCVMQARGEDIALDMYVPMQYQGELESAVSSHGYLPIRMSWERFGPPLMSSDALSERLETFTATMGGASVEQAEAVPAAAPGQTLGFVDEVTIDAGGLMVRGWAADSDGKVPDTLALRINGQDVTVFDLQRELREDVRMHLRLPHAMVGYRLRVEVPGVSAFRDIGDDFGVVLPGGGLLQLNAAVKSRLAGG